MSSGLSGLSGLSGWVGSALVYLLHDFVPTLTPDVAAPVPSPRTAVPGPGTIVITDAGNIVRVTSGRLRISGTTSGTTGWVGGTALARTPGLAVRWTGARMTTTGFARMGWAASLTSTMAAGILFASPITFQAIGEGGSTTDLVPQPADFWVVLRSAGFYFIGGNQLLWPSRVGTATNLKPVCWLGGSQTPDFDIAELGVVQLGYPWTQAGSPAVTAEYLTPATGQVAAAQADGWTELVWTPGAGEVVDLQVRRVDDANCYIVRANQATGRIYLYEKVAGVETERGATGGVAVTLTAGTPVTILISCIGTAIRSYVAAVAKNVYTTATVNATVGGSKASGFASVASFTTYRYYL